MSSRWASAHENTRGAGDARPTALQIVEDEGLRGKLTDKVILITGCSSGLGVETVRALVRTGATIYATARSLEKAQDALGGLAKLDRVHLLHLDLNSLSSVRACASEFLSKGRKLNILISNAAVMATPDGRTTDGFETQFGVNHLAHFLLFWLLKPTLLESSTPAFQSRVVIVSSSAHRGSEVHIDNINLIGEYDGWKAYGQSKTALIWTANEIDRRYGHRGLHAVSLHPGGIATGLQVHIPEEQKQAWANSEALLSTWKNVEQGAATTVCGAVAACLEGRGGLYLEDCQIAGPWNPATGITGSGYAPCVLDEEKAAKLWSKSLELLDLDNDR
ncbi:Short-chain dehydrogenase protein [Lasiodiplodia theobromae]|uniref:Short-chain dehydrogenase protein n=1 Tax=Lasiodiplodia theobromae TaxID=45133 RepID=UPI0015C2C3DB|nr:Short-chain dehydrogenase protein [Lasiodiplodia theobromae]KAF4545911.1 Short-chain dehydrogenase protein [Lasiodiplodia theobromae]